MSEERAAREVKAVAVYKLTNAEYARKYGITRRQASKIRMLPQDDQKAARGKSMLLTYHTVDHGGKHRGKRIGRSNSRGPGLPGNPCDTRPRMGKTERAKARGHTGRKRRRRSHHEAS